MEGLWNFSPRSESYLQRFLGAANENRASESRWVKFFEKRDTVSSGSTFEDKEKINEDLSVPSVGLISSNNVLDVGDLENYSDIIENNLENRFDEIVAACLENPNLLVVFADNLNVTLLEKFLKHIFKQRCIESQFVNAVFVKLLPVLISRQNSKWLLLSLSDAFAAHPDKFLTVTLPLLLSEKVCEDYLLNFCKILPLHCKNCLIKYLYQIPMDEDQFSRHINTIYELYKTVDRTSEVNMYIYRLLYNSSDVCCNDKMYGRLLLIFLQNDNLNMEYGKLKLLVDNHYSILKKACENALETKMN